MNLRIISLLALVCLIPHASMAVDKPKATKKIISNEAPEAKKKSHTWNSLIEYVYKNGRDKAFKGRRARLLGYDSDSLQARAMRYKSAISSDRHEHAIFVLHDKDAPKEVILGATLVTEKDKERFVEGHDIRFDLSGKPLSAFKATGKVGSIVNTSLDLTSAEAKSIVSAEKSFFLDKVDIGKLSK